MAFEKNRYLIVKVAEIDKCDFAELVITSDNTLQYSLDGFKTYIEWEGEQPNFVANLDYLEGPYTRDQMADVLRSSQWYKEIPGML